MTDWLEVQRAMPCWRGRGNAWWRTWEEAGVGEENTQRAALQLEKDQISTVLNEYVGF